MIATKAILSESVVKIHHGGAETRSELAGFLQRYKEFMNQYIVESILINAMSEAFYSLIPDHRQRINELMKDGTVTAYAVADDRTKLWMTMMAESEGAVNRMLDELPLRPYMVNTVRKLLVANVVKFITPHFSSN